MDIDAFSFLTTFLVARADNPNGDPTRAALVASLIPGSPAMRVLFATLVAGSPNATSPGAEANGASAAAHRIMRTASRPKVKVPRADQFTDKDEIVRHFRDHKLKARILERTAHGVASPVVVHQSPDRDEEVEEGSVVDVVYLTGHKRS